MRSGVVQANGSNNIAFRNAGPRGYSWSRQATTFSGVLYPTNQSGANSFTFNATDTPTKPSDISQHFNGFTLRCLSTAVEGEGEYAILIL